MYDIIYDIIYKCTYDIQFCSQVAAVEKELKMKIRPENAYFQLHNHDFLSLLPREELHQFLIGTYGEYVIPSSMHLIKKELRKPEFVPQDGERGWGRGCGTWLETWMGIWMGDVDGGRGWGRG